MRNMAVLHSPAFSYPLPVLVRVLFNLLIFKGKILYYNKYRKNEVKWLESTSHFHRETIKRAKHSLRISCRMKLFHYICKAV